MKHHLIAGSMVLAFLLTMPLMALADEADYVVTDAKIYTANPEQPWAQAIAISGPDIVYVGDNEGTAPFIGENTQVAALNGRVILPGIIATHEHPLTVMGMLSALAMENRGDKQFMLDSLKEYIAGHPEGPFFSFGGAYEGTVDITRHDIDAIISDKPFLMVASSGHGGWINTKGLEALGVVKDAPDPIDYFERDENGEPTGYIGTSAAIFHSLAQLRLIDKEAIVAGADTILGLLNSHGITGVYDAGISAGLEGSAFEAMHELEQDGRLTTRISASVAFAQRPMHIDYALEAMNKYGAMYNSELFRVTTLKIHGDGDWGGYTIGLLEPGASRPGDLGMVSFPDQEQLNDFMVETARRGYDIHVHVGGDRTARMILNGYEAVREAGFDEIRLTMGHTTLIHPWDKPRFVELDIIVNTFATNIAVDSPEWRDQIGEARYRLLQPMNSFVEQGVKVVLSADWPTEDINPFLHKMYTAMTRSRLGEETIMPPASEKLSLEAALRAYTADAAYALRMEDFTGSLEVGKRADLIVIDRDIFTIEVDEIPAINVLITMMNGTIVHQEAVDWEGETEAEEIIEDYDICAR
jgi:predicted amidohydrolase YtcJ